MRAMRGIGAAGVALSLLLVAGCSGQDPPPSEATPTTGDSTASETSAATTAPTSEVSDGAPVLPEAARQQTPEGAEAFVRYWFATLEYSWQVMDSRPILALGECLTCANFAATIDSVAARGHALEGNTIEIRSVEGQGGPGPTFTVTALFDAPEQREVDGQGVAVGVIEGAVTGIQYLFTLDWSDAAAKVSSIELIQ